MARSDQHKAKVERWAQVDPKVPEKGARLRHRSNTELASRMWHCFRGARPILLAGGRLHIEPMP
jgi:hypothetical protein